MMLEVGSSLGGRYRLLERIAIGGMGTVWRAQDSLLDRFVAIKVLSSGWANQPTSKARMLFEARAVAAVDSPHVVHIYDAGEEPSHETPYIVMEFVEGSPLSSVLREASHLPPNRVVEILREVAAGLAVAHAAGLVHRDIKPGNILIASTGVAKLTDFGIARSATSDDLTQTGTLVGTAKYLAPEQIEGKVATSASDVYALGVVAFECLTGRPPFRAESDLATALIRLREKAPPLPEHVPVALSQVIGSMLERDPARRPTVDELTRLSMPTSSDTREYTDVMPLPDMAAETVVLSQKGGSPRRLMWVGAALSGAVAIAIAIGIASSSQSGDGKPTPAVSSPSTVVVTSIAPPTTVSVSVTPPVANPNDGKGKGGKK